MAVIKCIYDVAKRFIVRSKWFLLLPVLCAVVIANVLIFALPDSAQAAPIHQAASSTSTQPHDPCAPGFTPVPSGNNSFKCVPIERHACVGDQTPETDPGCFLPDATNCADGACYQCVTIKTRPEDVSCIYDPDSPQIIDQYVHLPAAANNSLFIYTPPDLTVQHPVVVSLWKASLVIVDALVVISLMLHGIQIMIGGSAFRHANAVQAIPSTLLALVAAHMSLLIAVFFVSFNNSLSSGIYSWAASNTAFNTGINAQVEGSCDNLSDDQRQTIFHEGKNGYLYPSDKHYAYYFNNTAFLKGRQQVIVSQRDATKDYDPNEYRQFIIKTSREQLPDGERFYYLVPKPELECKRWDAEAFDAFNSFMKVGFVDSLKTLFGSIKDFMRTVFSFSMLALLGQIVMRFMLLDFYIVLGPLGIACWALPGRVGHPLTQSWLRGFISTALVQFVQATALLVAQGTMPLIDVQLKRALPGSDETLVWVIATAMVWFILRIPSLLGTAPMSAMMDVGQKVAQTAGAVISHDIAIFQTALSIGGSAVGAATMGIGGMVMGGMSNAVGQASGSITQAASAGGGGGGDDGGESGTGRRNGGGGPNGGGGGGGEEEAGPPQPRANGGGPMPLPEPPTGEV